MLNQHQRPRADAAPNGTVVPFRPHRQPVSIDVAHRHDDDDSVSAKGRSTSRSSVLGEEELRAIEGLYADGVSAVQIVDVFTTRGIKFSEASFRKYVQQGLLPRSKRIGRKGKHRGSMGVYPPKTIRRINTVKQLMADGHTIEEIQGQFLLYTDLAEGVEEHLTELLSRLAADIESSDLPNKAQLERELDSARKDGDRVVEKLSELTRKVAAPKTDRLRLAGAAGGAEDLL